MKIADISLKRKHTSSAEPQITLRKGIIPESKAYRYTPQKRKQTNLPEKRNKKKGGARQKG